MQALSHYSYHKSGGQLVLCDLQGGLTSQGAVLTGGMRGGRGPWTGAQPFVFSSLQIPNWQYLALAPQASGKLDQQLECNATCSSFNTA
jgi:hypothetical protein